MSNLLEQWNEYIVRGNELSRELENIETIIEKAKGEEICFTAKPNGATYISVLSPEKMQELRENVVVAIMQTRDEKAAELEKLMGLRKPATVNQVFETAVQNMVNQTKAIIRLNVKQEPDPDPAEEKLTEILKTEAKRIEAKPVDDNPSLDKYPARKTQRKKYPDGMTVESVTRMYVDEGKKASSIAVYFGLTTKEVENFMTINKIRRSTKKSAETECP